jgi:cellulose synthase (UDP-forming)
MIEKTPVSPYIYHVSEDIYTSLMLHSDPDRKWKSVLHPQVESKMLSPQDLLTWSNQRFKYAGGSLGIMLSSDCPLFLKGLSFWQKVMYMITCYFYFACVWNVIFLLAPIIYLYTGMNPISADQFDFFKHLFPFLIMNRLVIMVGTWGIDSWKTEQLYVSSFAINLQAIRAVLTGKKIKFNVTPKLRQEGSFLHLTKPQLAIIILTLGGIIFSFVKFLLGYSTSPSSDIMNSFWGLLNVALLIGVVRAAIWKPDEQ